MALRLFSVLPRVRANLLKRPARHCSRSCPLSKEPKSHFDYKIHNFGVRVGRKSNFSTLSVEPAG
jgi:hypothetical protein